MIFNRLGLVIAIIALSLPLLEIAVMIKVGSAIGFWPALAIMTSTAILGIWVLQTHGLIMMLRFREAMEAGRPPLEPVIEGVLLLAAGVLLILPGYISDLLGLSLLIPWLRHAVAKLVHDRLWGESGAAHDRSTEASARPDVRDDEEAAAERERRRARGAGPILEGEFERVDDPPRDRGGRKT